ncbi:hypothetical protein M8494_13690 [Serratia ureilytica]
MDLQRIQRDVRHAAQVDGAHRGAVRRGAVGEGLSAADSAELMADLVLIEGVGAELVRPLLSVKALMGKNDSSSPLRRQIEQLQLRASVGSSASTEKVTAPQWQLPGMAWRWSCSRGRVCPVWCNLSSPAAQGLVSLVNARFSGRLEVNVIKRRSRCWNITIRPIWAPNRSRTNSINGWWRQAALELIKATLSDTNDGNGVDFQLKAAEKHIGPMADAIQEALK